MTCVVCKQGTTAEGTTHLTLERGGVTVLIRHVPAHVCATCGEAYVAADVAERVQAIAHPRASAT